MKRNKLTSPTGLGLIAFLVVAALLVAWFAVRATALEMLSSQTAQISPLVARQPDVVLGTAMAEFTVKRGRVSPATLQAVKLAAARSPLDGRPYLLVGSDYLRARRTALAVQTLEAGRRLNPRERWIHLLLLERYLRAGRYTAAGDEFGVLARLVGPAQGPIATALAQMSVAPQTRDAALRTFRQDGELERSVLAVLAGSNISPAIIFDMASPAAVAAANLPGGWGSVLVDRLVRKQSYRQAHAVWQRINGLNDQQVAPLIYDAGIQQLPGKPPFGWQLASDNIAAVDTRGGKFNVDYYGRDSGELIAQLLVLSPGTYRFGYVVSGQQQTSASSIIWSFTCANHPDKPLVSMPVPVSSKPRRVAFAVTVPADCPAQWLRLDGQAGEFPQPVSAAIDHLQLDRASAS